MDDDKDFYDYDDLFNMLNGPGNDPVPDPDPSQDPDDEAEFNSATTQNADSVPEWYAVIVDYRFDRCSSTFDGLTGAVDNKESVPPSPNKPPLKAPKVKRHPKKSAPDKAGKSASPPSSPQGNVDASSKADVGVSSRDSTDPASTLRKKPTSRDDVSRPKKQDSNAKVGGFSNDHRTDSSGEGLLDEATQRWLAFGLFLMGFLFCGFLIWTNQAEQRVDYSRPYVGSNTSISNPLVGDQLPDLNLP